MNFRRRSLLFVVALSCAGCGGGGGGGGSAVSPSKPAGCPALPPTSSGSMLETIVDGAVASQMTTLGVPGVSVALGKRGTVLIAKGYGYADLGSCQPATAQTEFQIGSVTKQFTAAAVLQLAASGALNIDDRLSAHLPSYGFDPRITLRMLLNHTSGYPDYVSFPDAGTWAGGVSQQTVLTQIAGSSLLFTPGSAYFYSNSNYYVLGAVIEAVSSLSYPDYLSGQVYPTAGLTHTQYTEPASFAAAYSSGTSPAVIADPSFEFAAGALWSNVMDLTAWTGALYDFQVIPSAYFSMMVTPPAVVTFQQSAPSNYGMGWARGMAVGHDFAWHDGETSGYGAFNGVFLDDGFSISILANNALSGEQMEAFAVAILHAVCTNAATTDSC